MSRTAKFLLYGVGTALFLASLLFLGAGLARNWSAVESVRVVEPFWFVASGVIFATSHLSTGLAWPLAVSQLGQRMEMVTGLRIGLVSQIGKYLPGNIAHYFSRGALGRTAGITLRSSGLSTLVELLSALAAALLVAFVMLLEDPQPLGFLPQVSAEALVGATAIVTAGLALAAWIASRGYGFGVFAAPTACFAISVFLSGLSLYALLISLGHPEPSLASVVGAFALAWAIGFIIPGAPAGLGVREAVLVGFLTQEVGAGVALACAILHRIITAGVDALAALAGYGWLASASLSKK